MLFSELYKIMVNKVTFAGFKGGRSPQSPLDPPLLRLDIDFKLIAFAHSSDQPICTTVPTVLDRDARVLVQVRDT